MKNILRAIAFNGICRYSVLCGTLLVATPHWAQSKEQDPAIEEHLHPLQDSLAIELIQNKVLVEQSATKQISELVLLQKHDTLWNKYITQTPKGYVVSEFYKDSLDFRAATPLQGVVMSKGGADNTTKYVLYQDQQAVQSALFDPSYAAFEFVRTQNSLSLEQKKEALPLYNAPVIRDLSEVKPLDEQLKGYELVEQTPDLKVYKIVDNPFSVVLESNEKGQHILYHITKKKNVLEVFRIDLSGEQINSQSASVTLVGMQQKRTYTHHGDGKGIWDMYAEIAPSGAWQVENQYYRDFNRLRDKGIIRARVVVYNESLPKDELFFKLLLALNYDLELFRQNILVSDLSFTKLLSEGVLYLQPSKSPLYQVQED